MTHIVVEVQTLAGPLSFRWDDEAPGIDADGAAHQGAVIASAFASARHFADAADLVVQADAARGRVRAVVTAVQAWNSGRDLDALGRVPVAQPGGAFRQRCWQALRGVVAGDVVSYGTLAAMAGNAAASRAVGSAMAGNAVAPFVPCHRVVRADGALGHYSAADGTITKAALLAHEGVTIA